MNFLAVYTTLLAVSVSAFPPQQPAFARSESFSFDIILLPSPKYYIHVNKKKIIVILTQNC